MDENILGVKLLKVEDFKRIKSNGAQHRSRSFGHMLLNGREVRETSRLPFIHASDRQAA